MRSGIVNPLAVQLPHQNLDACFNIRGERYSPFPVTFEIPHASVDEVVAQRFPRPESRPRAGSILTSEFPVLVPPPYHLDHAL